MIDCASFDERLDDYVDGALDETGRRQVEAHAAACPRCAAALEAQRRLLKAAAELPREIAPPRDLLPAIRRATHATATRSTPWWLGLAASLLLAGGLAVVYGPWRADGTSLPGAPPGDGEAVPATAMAGFRAAEDEYQRAAEMLLASIEQRADRLAPETVATLRRNLAIIDEAIDEIRVALLRDPGHAANTELLAAMYQQKIQLLWRVSRLAS